jgi:hypothetical protein
MSKEKKSYVKKTVKPFLLIMEPNGNIYRKELTNKTKKIKG